MPNCSKLPDQQYTHCSETGERALSSRGYFSSLACFIRPVSNISVFCYSNRSIPHAPSQVSRTSKFRAGTMLYRNRRAVTVRDGMQCCGCTCIQNIQIDGARATRTRAFSRPSMLEGMQRMPCHACTHTSESTRLKTTHACSAFSACCDL